MMDLIDYGFKVEGRAPASERNFLDVHDSASRSKFLERYKLSGAESPYQHPRGIKVEMTPISIQPWIDSDDDRDYMRFKHSEQLEEGNTPEIMSRNFVIATKTMKKVMVYVKELEELLNAGITVGGQRFEHVTGDSGQNKFIPQGEDYDAARVVIDPFFGDDEIGLMLNGKEFACAVKLRSSALKRLQAVNSPLFIGLVKEALQDMESHLPIINMLKEMLK
jgi:hypothetical protein